MPRYNYITAIRGIAILLVLMVHTAYNGSYFKYIPVFLSSIIEFGKYGVQLFFMASAFTLFLSFQNRKEKEEYAIRNFFIRRFFRIAPMWYIGIIYYTFQNYLGTHPFLNINKIPWHELILNGLFINSLSPKYINSFMPGSWSISVEMLFYLVVPFFVLYISNINKAIYLFIGTTLLAIIVNGALLYKGVFTLNTPFLYLWLINQLPVFSIGIFIFFYVEHNQLPNYTLIGGCIILCLLYFFIFHIPLLFVSIVLAIFFAFLSKYPILMFVNKIVLSIGEWSYSIYIIHIAVLTMLNRVGLADFFNVTNTSIAILNYLIRFLILVSVSSIIAFIANKLIERPGQKLGKHLIAVMNKKV